MKLTDFKEIDLCASVPQSIEIERKDDKICLFQCK